MKFTSYVSEHWQNISLNLGRLIRKAKQKATNNTTSEISRGLDSPHVSIESDVLGRYNLAREIYTTLTSQPRDLAVRFGLYGDWGAGKTTIANWISDIAKRDGHIVVLFNPWAFNTVDGMWWGLAGAIHGKLEEHKIDLPVWRELKSLLSKGWQHTKATDPVRGFATVIDRIFRFHKADIDKLTVGLKGKRLLVIIDDMDRADSELLPKLLLSLREIFDIKGFSFLVPFEKSKVVAALEKQRPEWNGEEFLEKLFDYQKSIPDTTVNQRWALFEAGLQKVLPEAPIDSLRSLSELLPDNPRRIKRVTLGIDLRRRQILRHRADEIDWYSVVCALILQLESEKFFERYTDEAFHNSEKRMTEGFRSKNAREREEAARERIVRIADETIQDASRKARVVDIAMRWDAARVYWDNNRVIYALELFDKPHIFTWFELDKLVSQWRNAPSDQTLLSCMAEIAEEKHLPRELVRRDLVETLSKFYRERLESAADVFTRARHGTELDRAEEALSMLEQLVLGPADLSEVRALAFEMLFAAVAPFAHFSGNERDRALRQREIEVLHSLAGQAGSAWRRFVKIVEQAERENFAAEIASNLIMKSLLPLFDEQVDKALFDSIKENGGLRKVLQDEKRAMDRFLEAEGPLWRPESNSRLVKLFAEASENDAIQRNAYFLITMAIDGVPNNIPFNDQFLHQFLQSPVVGPTIWNAAIANPIQYRSLYATRKCRAKLIELGIPEQDLLFPDWLRHGEESDDERY